MTFLFLFKSFKNYRKYFHSCFWILMEAVRQKNHLFQRAKLSFIGQEILVLQRNSLVLISSSLQIIYSVIYLYFPLKLL